jgi:hypothetical protein
VSRVLQVEQFNDRLDNLSVEILPQPQRGPVVRRVAWLVATACGLLAAALMTFARPGQAAVAVQYFEASANAYGVLLSWGTSSEQNVQTFDIFCKKVGEPDSAYHFIHSVTPKGSLSEAADYSWLVEARTLAPGQAYCFRVKEISTEPGLPGWSRDACGFGISITPTPTPTQTAVIVEVTATPVFVNAAAPPVDPGLATPTATPVGFSMPATPDFFLTATAVAAQTASADALATQNAAAAASFDNVAPTATLDPAAMTATMDAFNSQQPTPTPTFTPTEQIPSAVDPNMDPGVADAGAGVTTALLQLTPSPTSLYVVSTAEPTPAAVALASVLTPWPTATPAPALAMAGLLSPTAQNLTVMLLCFIFVSASGLGALGLITSVIYIRSQSRRRELEELRRRSRY